MEAGQVARIVEATVLDVVEGLGESDNAFVDLAEFAEAAELADLSESGVLAVVLVGPAGRDS